MEAISGFWQKHFVWNFILLKSPAVWFTFIYSLFGNKLGFLQTDQEGAAGITPFGIVVLCTVAAFIVVFNVILMYDERNNGQTKALEAKLQEATENAAVLADLKDRKTNLCEEKLQTLTTCIERYVKDGTLRAPEIVSNPRNQLNLIANELSRNLFNLLKFDNKKYGNQTIYTSIIYRFPNDSDKNWHWATRQRGLSINQLMAKQGDKESTFLYLLKKEGHIEFQNSKQKAYEKDRYIPDTEDTYENERLKGSIACFQYQIKANDTEIVDFVITISTYERQFLEGEDDCEAVISRAKDNINRIIMPEFVIRAKIELCLLYLEHLNQTRRK